jgi:sodium transport system ATP-binding protein
MIEARGLAKRFGTVTALQDISFRADDGRITGLLGPNGAGKSTTLRILQTLISADAGQALIDGQATSADPLAVRARIGVLPHSAAIYAGLTARENIIYFGRLCGMSRAASAARANTLIAQLDIGDIADRRAKGFSQGQRLKTALARAMVHEPRNLMLDEPTNGLDVPSVRMLRALLAQLRSDGHCILFSSHVMHEVASLCDDIVVIARGQVVATGSPEALLAQTGASDLESAFVQLTDATSGAA